MARAPGVGRVVGAVGRAAVVVHEAVVGALVADHRDARCLSRLDVGGRRPLVGRADDRHGRAGAGSGDRRRAARRLPSPRQCSGHADHPVERDGPVEAPGAGGLEREHAAHAEPGDAHGLHARAGRRRPRGRRGRRRRRSCPPSASRSSSGSRLPARPRLDGDHGPAVLVRESLDVVVEQRSQPDDVGDEHEASRRRRAIRRGERSRPGSRRRACVRIPAVYCATATACQV